MRGRLTGNRLAVWGDPIAHSKSPDLHAAAYRVLGLDWEYGRRQVSAEAFRSTVGALDATWRGLSLTMPLKEEAFRVAATKDRHAELSGAVNTLLLGDAPVGFNTDVGGIVDALGEAGITRVGSVRILGAGATAASALVAAAEMGATHVEVRARRPERAAGLRALGARSGVVVDTSSLDDVPAAVELTIATLPSGTELPIDSASALAETGGVLFDAAYAPWPSALASRWGDGTVVSGLGMLLHQAVRQIRIFRHGDPTIALPGEQAVVSAMRAAL
ncbi:MULTISPECIES: shikimate dehydrogenase [unclassified Microbacterium]|uniref:shikimate dehydrogenase family protein n=1 Tax=unclassified Microbacterium TaxID=2609290 RepID=UPI001604D431|nr:MULTISPECIES: shikimate dehydrogenase [unclassified Microbacterium]QNA92666.1 shikimate dehydrogenase [Microbacterium sp. Se63.02b]QYM62796.1 shikimate dehydrogenase [Microbacterium sp. Se5.02b]